MVNLYVEWCIDYATESVEEDNPELVQRWVSSGIWSIRRAEG